MRETYAYTILEKKTKKLRAETGNEKLRSAADTGVTPQELFSTSIIRPTKMLLFSPIILLLSLYMAIIYGYLYLLFTAMPTLYAVQYGFSTGSIGLTYIGSGIGSILGLALSGGLSDRLMTRLTAKNGGEPKPEYRLPTMVIASFFVPLGLFVYGWTAEKNLHWILPIVGMGFLSFGMMCAFVSLPSILFSLAEFPADNLEDGYLRLHCRCLHSLRSISHVGHHRSPITGRSASSFGRWTNVQFSRLRMGYLPTRIHRCSYDSRSHRLPHVR